MSEKAEEIYNFLYSTDGIRIETIFDITKLTQVLIAAKNKYNLRPLKASGIFEEPDSTQNLKHSQNFSSSFHQTNMSFSKNSSPSKTLNSSNLVANTGSGVQNTIRHA